MHAGWSVREARQKKQIKPQKNTRDYFSKEMLDEVKTTHLTSSWTHLSVDSNIVDLGQAYNQLAEALLESLQDNLIC